jgi:Flp pilus assembly protein CpaB
MAYRARNIMIAVALAAVAALLTSFYVTSYKRHVQRGEDHVTVLVAKKDIPVGANGADVASQLSSLDVPGRASSRVRSPSADQLAASSPPSRHSRVSSSPRAASAPHPRRCPGQLSGTLRAVSIEGDQNQLLAGTLKDGDSVDFVAALKKPGDQDIYFSRVLVRDLKVLQAPASRRPAASSPARRTRTTP